MLLSRNASLNITKPCLGSSVLKNTCTAHVSSPATPSNETARRRRYLSSLTAPKQRRENNPTQPGGILHLRCRDFTSSSLLSTSVQATPESTHFVSGEAGSSPITLEPRQAAEHGLPPLDPISQRLEKMRLRRERRKERKKARKLAASVESRPTEMGSVHSVHPEEPVGGSNDTDKSVVKNKGMCSDNIAEAVNYKFIQPRLILTRGP
jgi:hypothetical protein